MMKAWNAGTKLESLEAAAVIAAGEHRHRAEALAEPAEESPLEPEPCLNPRCRLSNLHRGTCEE